MNGEQFHQKWITSSALSSGDKRMDVSIEVNFIMSRRPKTRKGESFQHRHYS